MPIDTTANQRNRRIDRFVSAVSLIAVCVMITFSTAKCRWLWDDAFFFLRYARNTFNGDWLAWNPHGPPADGLTSPLWLAVTLCSTYVADLLSWEWTRMLKAQTLFASFLWVLCLYRMGRGVWPRGARFWHCVPLAVLVLDDPGFLLACRSGMETMMAAAAVALTLHLFLRLERRARAKASQRRLFLVDAPATAISAFLCATLRPELALFAAMAPALLAWKHRQRPRQAKAFLLTFILVALLGALFACLRLAVYGDVVPLPGQVKAWLWSMPYEGYSEAALSYLRTEPIYFFRHYPLLIWAAPFIMAKKELRRETAWVWAPMLILTAYNFMILPIMGYGCRFFQPLIPMYLFLCWTSVRHAAPRAPGRAQRALSLALAATVLIIGLTWCGFQLLHRKTHPEEQTTRLNAGLIPEMATAVEFVSQCPPGTRVAATEVGYLGYRANEAQIIDISGLNDPEFNAGFSADALFERHPDIITLVHGDYGGMCAGILEHPDFKRFKNMLTPSHETPNALDYAKDPDYLRDGVFVDSASPFYESIAGLAGNFIAGQ
jgi:hypothetical protein